MAVIIGGSLYTWWLAAQADRQMREDLLTQARLVAAAINLESVRSLSGNDSDLSSPDYQQLKKQFMSVHAAHPSCRFVYLMGRKADGTLYFVVDSEPVGSEDYSPPGQVYEEVSEAFTRAFDTKTVLTEGPVSDHWGTWISAHVPLTDPRTNKLIAMLGMDFDAHRWNWDVAANSALSAVLMLLLMVMIVLIAVLRRRSVSIMLNEQKYRYLFEGAAGGIAIVRSEKIEFANPALARMVGYPIETITSVPFLTLVHPEDQSLIQDRYSRRMRGETVETGYDFRIIAADGSDRWLNINSQMINWEGEPANLCFLTDITDRKLTEEKLTAMYEETNRMNRLMVGREDRLLELKREVNKLSMQLNQGIVYKSVEDLV
jgi:PAS domain S-box-containing protein